MVKHPHERRGVMVLGMKLVQLHQGDGLETSLAIWRKIGSLKPIVFIDGDYSYGSVIREIEGIIAAIPEASMLLHDTFFHSAESRYNVGSHTAVAETLAKTPGKYEVIHSGLSLPGMTLLAQLS